MNFNFYPRPPRGGRRGGLNEFGQLFGISIHALREEGDQRKVSLVAVLEEFLSTPSARRATDAPAENDGKGRFLSTPSARRATA